MIELDWSKQSPHIRTLYHSWQRNDGCDETTIQATEARLGIRLQATLRSFYLAWGQRPDLTTKVNPLLSPAQLKMEGEALTFCVGNQGVVHWGVRREAIGEADPPVVFTYPEWPDGQMALPVTWISSHAQLSSFLDDLTYLHAFSGGAIHGAYTSPTHFFLPAGHRVWLEDNWGKAAVSPLAFQMTPDTSIDNIPTLYVRDGQALSLFLGCSIVAHEAAAIDEIGQRFGIDWATRW